MRSTPPVTYAASVTVRTLAVMLIGATGCGDPLPTPTAELTPADLERVGLTLPGGTGGVPFDCAISVLLDDARKVRVIDGTQLLPQLLERKGEMSEFLRMYADVTEAPDARERNGTARSPEASIPGQLLEGKLDFLLLGRGRFLGAPLPHLLGALQSRELAAANRLGLPEATILGDFCLFADTDASYDTLSDVLYQAGLAGYTSLRIVEAHAGGRWVGTPIVSPEYDASGAPTPPYLTVAVTADGFALLGSTEEGPTLLLPAPADPTTGEPIFPTADLTARLRELRGQFDASQPLVIALDTFVPASVLTRTFTAVRADAQGELFPRISLGLSVE
jgi:hypothetical protein